MKELTGGSPPLVIEKEHDRECDQGEAHPLGGREAAVNAAVGIKAEKLEEKARNAVEGEIRFYGVEPVGLPADEKNEEGDDKRQTDSRSCTGKSGMPGGAGTSGSSG